MLKLFQQKKKNPKKNLKKVLGDYQLPTFPAIAQQIMEVIRSPKVSNSLVSGLIAQDPGLTTSVLRTVNSAAFSPIKRINSLEQAVAMIGLSPLESLILSVSVVKTLPGSSSPQHSMDGFWLASARRAAVARAIAAELHPVTVCLSYSAGLLQDMAIPFLINQRPEEYGRILECWRNSEENLVELERAEFDWDHAEVATWICSEWNLPDPLSAAIGGHHGAVIDGFEVPPAVMLVSCIRENRADPGTQRLLEAAQIQYGMNPDRVAGLVRSGFEAAEELARLFTSRR